MVQSNYVRQKYDSINNLDDLKKFISNSKDGETPWLEFKAIKKEKGTQKNKFIEHQKSLLAKEICAFLNTSDGIIVWGIEYVKDGNIKIINEYDGNIYDLFDGFIQTILEPIPSGIDFKPISDNGKDALLIFVPKSKFSPHRVCGDAESKFARNYYARSGTNSIPLNEGIVRSLYLADGHIPKISVFTEPRIESEGHISLNILAKPDSVCYVDHYYDSEEFLLLDENGKNIEINKNGSSWTKLIYLRPQTGIGYPIYPATAPIPLSSNDIIRSDTLSQGTSTPSTMSYGDIKLTKEDFERIKYIFTKSYFACNGVQLTTDRRLYVLDSVSYIDNLIQLGQNKFQFIPHKVLEKVEKEYNLKIFILNTYDDSDIVDDFDSGILTQSKGNRLTLSFLKQLLDEYNEKLNN